jgi:hypothetical protein
MMKISDDRVEVRVLASIYIPLPLPFTFYGMSTRALVGPFSLATALTRSTWARVLGV